MRKISIVIAVIIAFSYAFFRFGQFDSKLALSNQIEHILQEHDQESIESLSLDEQTKEFLLKLPKETNIRNITDLQGGTKEWGYFAAKAENTPIHVFMRVEKQSIMLKLFPKWTLFKITIAPGGKLPIVPELSS